MPPPSETQRSMLKELTGRVAEAAQQSGVDQSRLRDVFLKGLGPGAAARALREDVVQWWAAHWKSVVFGVAGAAALAMAGPLALGAAAVAVGIRGRQNQENTE